MCCAFGSAERERERERERGGIKGGRRMKKKGETHSSLGRKTGRMNLDEIIPMSCRT